MKRGCTYRHIDRWEEFMKYIVEMGSGAMICIPSFINICSGILKLMGEKDSQSQDSMVISKSYLNFFKIKGVG
jgi:hypothetical protein